MMKLTGRLAGGLARLDRHDPVGTVVVDLVGQARRRPLGGHAVGDGIAPQVETPARVVAIGSLVADVHEALRLGL